jgi:proline iminopeptidase
VRRYFDPHAYRIVLFDQRNCGRSLPPANDLRTDLSVNTTAHLLVDMEHLRQHLEIDQWLLFGGSWGSTLGLAYAEQYPHRVTEIVLGSVTTTRRTEIDWLYRGVAPLFPAQWAHFCAGVPPAERDGDLVAAYCRLLHGPDPAIHLQAARDAAVASVDPDAPLEPRRLQPAWQLTFARIVTHYFCHNAWLEEGILLRQAHVLAHIPGILVHGRLDLGSPLVTAWELAQAWPNSELVIVRGAGHAATDPGMSAALIAATDRFATRR